MVAGFPRPNRALETHLARQLGAKDICQGVPDACDLLPVGRDDAHHNSLLKLLARDRSQQLLPQDLEQCDCQVRLRLRF